MAACMMTARRLSVWVVMLCGLVPLTAGAEWWEETTALAAEHKENKSADLFGEIPISTYYLGLMLKPLGRENVFERMPSVRLKLWRASPGDTYEIRGMRAGFFGDSLWMGYEYLEESVVMGTVEGRIKW